MLKMFQRFVAVALCLAPTALAALGVGGLDVSSGLNQPFDAKIPLVGAQQGELIDVKARLAEKDVFTRAGLERPFQLSMLKFAIVPTGEASGYIHITSREGVREPAMEFIVEVKWPGGSLQRQYSVLLEPR